MKIKKLSSLFISLIMFSSLALADVTWKFFEQRDLPWDIVYDIKSYGGYVYACAGVNPAVSSSIQPNPAIRIPTIFRSVDGENWETVSIFTHHSLNFFHIYDGHLFLFYRESKDFSLRVKRSTNGVDWEDLTIPFTLGNWSSAVIFNSLFYAATDTGEIWQMDERANPPQWIMVHDPATELYDTQLAEFDGILYRSYVTSNVGAGPFPLEFDRSQDVQNWNALPGYGVASNLTPFIEKDGYLYYPVRNALIKTNGQFISPPNHFWDTEYNDLIGISDDSMFAALLHNQLYLFGWSNEPVVQTAPPSSITSSGKWERIGLPASQFIWIDRSTNYKDWAFLSGRTNFVGLKNGLTDIILTPSLSENLSPGQSDKVVLSFNMMVNFYDERINAMVIENKGTAVDGRDITSLKVYLGQSDFTHVADLEPIASNRWKLPDAIQLPVNDGDLLQIRAEISETAENGTTLQLAVDSDNIVWNVNHTLTLPSNFMSEAVYSINVAAAAEPAALEGAEVFPQPARTQALIRYTLENTSDVNVKIYNRTGTLVSEIVDNGKSPELRSSTTWDLNHIASGVYYAVIEITPVTGSKKIIKEKIFVQK